MNAKELVIETLKSGNWVTDKVQEVLKPFELSSQQFNVLRILRGQKGKPANLSDIQERMITKMSNTTRLVDKLITKGYTERMVCPENRRKVEITITKNGLDILDKIDPLLENREKELISNLSNNEAKQLLSLLKKMKS